ELTKEILEERGMTVDEDKFREYVAEARARAKADAASKDVAEAWKGKGDATKDIPATEFLGYSAFETDAKVLAVVKEGDLADSAETGEDAVLVVDRSTFYARSGGQIGDTGIIECGGFTFRVDDTVKSENGVYLHSGTVAEGIARAGEAVTVKIDADRRRSIMRNHTAAHLLQAALREVLGSHVEQAGQLVSESVCRFDFNHPQAMTAEEVKAVEARVNEIILQDVPVETKVMSIEDAKKEGAMMLFGEKYGETVRVVCVEDYSKEFCGGTHVPSTATLGLFKVVSESSVAAGVRRIEAVTGTNLLDYIEKKDALIAGAAAAMKSNVNDIDRRAAQLTADLKASEKKIEELNKELAAISAKDMMGEAIDLGAVRLVVSKVDGVNGGELRNMADSAKENDADLVVVFAAVNGEKANFACACGPDAVKAGAHAGNIVREVAKVAGGSGGGKPDSAMAGGKDASKVDDALAAAADIVKGMLN
ncbi:MAG: alanine--tRNA ligase, partial [Clostridia bacterium]|nr:alanine--tRNA ligase [Clostridia bacterium]